MSRFDTIIGYGRYSDTSTIESVDDSGVKYYTQIQKVGDLVRIQQRFRHDYIDGTPNEYIAYVEVPYEAWKDFANREFME